MPNGEMVTRFEQALAEYCGARYCVSASNGTVTLQAALIALGIEPGDRVAVPPLTMSATTIAVLNVGAVPVFCDVDPDTWLIDPTSYASRGIEGSPWGIPVSLYGLHWPTATPWTVDDAAQTLRPHGGSAFTSLSFQASKILALGEGGALLTNDENLASRARSYLSLGYRMDATQARIDSHALRSPTFDRHHTWPAINGRLNDITATEGLRKLERHGWARDSGDDFGDSNDADMALANRRVAASYYRRVVNGCDFLTPQHVPEGWTHDYWTFAVACDTPERALRLADAIVKHGGERPYPCWRITYAEPAFKHLDPGVMAYGRRESPCPVAEDLQPRLLQFQTNNLSSAERNASALRKAIEEVG